ncbi:MAG: hypothetical protein U0003_00655 [Vampirovibrionales bacterium]
MMTPAFESFLSEQPAALQQRALLWLWASQGSQAVSPVQSAQLNRVLDALENITSQEGVAILAEQSLQEAVGITILNEFGPSFSHKPAFHGLVSAVCHRLQD